MWRRNWIINCFVICSVALSGCGKETPDQAASRELKENRKRMAEIEKALKNALNESVALTKEIETLRKEIADLQDSAEENSK